VTSERSSEPTNARQSSRYSVYRQLMNDQAHWGKTIAIVTCKMLRKSRNADEFGRILELLSNPALRYFVEQQDWHLVLTGGTFKELRPVLGQFSEYSGRLYRLAPSALGVIQIANLVVFGHLLAIFFFNDMEDLYADSPQNLCLRRICNEHHTPLFEDFTSIEYILEQWRTNGPNAPGQKGSFPTDDIAAYYGSEEFEDAELLKADLPAKERSDPKQRSRETIAVVSHNEMKMIMLNFCLQHMDKILGYRRILATGTTGARLRDQYRSALQVLLDRVGADTFHSWPWTPKKGETIHAYLAKKIQPFLSGPNGGDIQISCKVIDGTCHRVLFFQDPQTAHAHQFDIRLMEKVVQDQETAALFATSVDTAELVV